MAEFIAQLAENSFNITPSCTRVLGEKTIASMCIMHHGLWVIQSIELTAKANDTMLF